MKKLIILMLALVPVISVGCADNSPKDGVKETEHSLESEQLVSGTEAGTIKLTRDGFLTKVMNYEENQNEWVFEGDLPCIVDFYADWCPPCRITSPILEELAIEYHGKINVYKVDVDRERELAGIFQIQSIPSFLYCPMEGQPLMSAGIARTAEETKEMFRNQIETILLNNQQ